jgi:hypothetical protein
LYDPYPVLVHNRCSDFELISPVCFGHNATWHISPDQKVDTNAIIGASFGRSLFEIEFSSALIYKLQRKKRLESNGQSDVNSVFTEDTLTSVQLLVIWRINDDYDFCVRALLIKHSNTITWNENALEKLHSTHLFLCKAAGNIEDTWLLDDAAVLVTTSKWKVGRTFEITISEGTRKDDTMEPLWVSLNM